MSKIQRYEKKIQEYLKRRELETQRMLNECYDYDNDDEMEEGFDEEAEEDQKSKSARVYIHPYLASHVAVDRSNTPRSPSSKRALRYNTNAMRKSFDIVEQQPQQQLQQQSPQLFESTSMLPPASSSSSTLLNRNLFISLPQRHRQSTSSPASASSASSASSYPRESLPNSSSTA